MLKPICFSLLLICFSTGNATAQEKPEFIAQIERIFREKEPGWKVEDKHVQNETGFFKQEMVFRSGKAQAVVSITLWRREKDAHDVFE